MSVKSLDRQGRWRNKTVAFRVSPEEDALIESAVKLSGLTKQDYIMRRLQEKDIVVQGNPKVYKALKSELKKVLEELQRIEAGAGINADLLEVIQAAAVARGYSVEELEALRAKKAEKRGGFHERILLKKVVE